MIELVMKTLFVVAIAIGICTPSVLSYLVYTTLPAEQLAFVLLVSGTSVIQIFFLIIGATLISSVVTAERPPGL